MDNTSETPASPWAHALMFVGVLAALFVVYDNWYALMGGIMPEAETATFVPALAEMSFCLFDIMPIWVLVVIYVGCNPPTRHSLIMQQSCFFLAVVGSFVTGYFAALAFASIEHEVTREQITHVRDSVALIGITVSALATVRYFRKEDACDDQHQNLVPATAEAN